MRNLVHGQHGEENTDKDERAEDYDGKLMKDLEHEETVKDMIYKLETKSASTTKPRIIESRCIEKVFHATNNAQLSKDNSKVIINNQVVDAEKSKVPMTSSSPSPTTSASTFIIPPSSLSIIDPHNEYEEYVTVNNHISISSKTSELNNPPTILQHENGTENDSMSKVHAVLKPKIVRNKNVDLALLAAVNKKTENGKNLKGLSSSDTESIFSQNDSLNEHEISNAVIKTSRNNNISKMPSVEMVRHQDKMNSSSPFFQHHPSDAQEKSLMTIISTNKTEDKPVKMVNWGTVGTINKEYIMNDNRLVHHRAKTFEEMEFEEFEVAGEHYDSLNSK